MQLKAIKDFSWAHRHVEIREYKVEDIIETDDQDLIDVATREGWAIDAAADGAQEATAKPAKQGKAAAKSPEQAAADGAPEVKAG